MQCWNSSLPPPQEFNKTCCRRIPTEGHLNKAKFAPQSQILLPNANSTCDTWLDFPSTRPLPPPSNLQLRSQLEEHNLFRLPTLNLEEQLVELIMAINVAYTSGTTDNLSRWDHSNSQEHHCQLGIELVRHRKPQISSSLYTQSHAMVVLIDTKII